MSTEPTYGNCPVCGRLMRLKKDGTVFHHGGDRKTSGWDAGRREYRCKGTDQPASAS